MTSRNLTTTLEDGRISTWRFPRFSAFEMVFRVSANADMRVIYRVSSAMISRWMGSSGELSSEYAHFDRMERFQGYFSYILDILIDLWHRMKSSLPFFDM
jgi:hypothetical protein